MTLQLRQATQADVAFLADVVITATVAQNRFPPDVDVETFRAGYEAWTRETVLGGIPGCTLSVIEWAGTPIGRFRVVRTPEQLTLSGIQLLPPYQGRGLGTSLIEGLKAEAEQMQLPLRISVEKDNPHAQRLYERLGCRQIGEDEQEYHLEYRPASS